MGFDMHMILTPATTHTTITKDTYTRLLIELTKTTPKGLLDPSIGFALQVCLGMVNYEDLPFTKTTLGRIKTAVVDIRLSGLLESFGEVWGSTEQSQEQQQEKTPESVLSCIGPNPNQTSEETEIPVSLDLPARIEQGMLDGQVDPSLFVSLWFHESRTKRLTYRLRIQKNLDAFVYRVQQGWVENPSGFFRQMVAQNWVVSKDSPDVIAQRKAERALKAPVIPAPVDDAQRMKEAAQRDAESVQANPQSLQLDKSLLEMLKTYHKRHGKLEQMHLSMLKSAGVQDWQAVIGA